ncbi:MAG: imidazole glycerol phosphate synthase subunit HisH [Deltaproteobacteria bacterium]|nr:imidazole glycerol phosphate synthase subunit HisH [Deltaproteobacteria bacterium]MBW2691891.1 imidazole glycerol phosphate synthase subunit HisH [Deltaproteobacteria bacterium]
MSASPRIAVVDFGAGNLRSVAKALERSGMNPDVTADPAAVNRADGVVLPGVGAFADAVASLAKTGLDDAVRDRLAARRPYLGLCLGLQVLFDEGDEHGVTPGLGVLPGRVERFPDQTPDGEQLRVPHIGWNTVKFSGDHPMLSRLPDEDCFYFVHSYRAIPNRASDVVGRVDYGGEFAAAVAREGMFAVQFHPEKSQSAGRRLLDAYAFWVSGS